MRNKIFSLIGVFIAVSSLLFFGGCAALNDLNVTITPTYTLAFSPTPRDCPPLAEVSAGETSPLPPYLVVVLFDAETQLGTITYSDNGEPQATEDVLLFLKTLLGEVFEPGDRYSIFRLGLRQHEYKVAQIINYGSEGVNYLEPPTEPILKATITPLPAPTDYGQTLFEQTAVARTFSQTATVHEAMETQIAFENDCMKTDWGDIYATEQAAWENSKQVTESDYVSEIVGEIDAQLQIRSEWTETYSSKVVWEGLAFATVIFQNECARYEKCILIVFDDLLDWRDPESIVPEKPDDLEVDLSRVEIISVMAHCLDIYDPKCTPLQEAWETQFLKYNAANPVFVNGIELDQYLIEYLGERE